MFSNCHNNDDQISLICFFLQFRYVFHIYSFSFIMYILYQFIENLQKLHVGGFCLATLIGQFVTLFEEH